MIISRTPFRISFVGGGTDLPQFYKEYGGSVLSTSIDKYIYISVHKYFDENRSLLKYSKTELIEFNNQIEHPIIQTILDKFSITNIDLNSTADIPAGTGMGSSSSFTVGLINAISKYSGITLSNQEIASLACEIEIDILNEPIGKQDQFAAAIGGFNKIDFETDGNVKITPLDLKKEELKKLEDNLILFYTGGTRSASKILETQARKTKNSYKTRDSLRRMCEMSSELFHELSSNNLSALGEYLAEGWKLKRSLSSGITNNFMDEIYDNGIRSGAVGGKLLGAGGSGFFLFFVEKKYRKGLIENLKPLKEYPFKFENQGTKIIFK